jgi:hypothetical protein
MIFNSLAYMLLLFLSRLVLPLTTAPALVLLSSSIIFYIFAGPFDFIIFASSLIFNWLIAIAVRGTQPRIFVAVIFNLGLLFFFKYADFFSLFSLKRKKRQAALSIWLYLWVFRFIHFRFYLTTSMSRAGTLQRHQNSNILFYSFHFFRN